MTRLPTLRIDEEDCGYESPCWIWRGHCTDNGYGLVTRSGKRLRAHRYFFEQLVGAIPPELTIDHLCSMKKCVNPDHLEPVSLAENIARGNARRGHNGPAKLRDWQVREIRRVREECELTSGQLGRAFGVHDSMIRLILSQQAWKEIA